MAAAAPWLVCHRRGLPACRVGRPQHHGQAKACVLQERLLYRLLAEGCFLLACPCAAGRACAGEWLPPPACAACCLLEHATCAPAPLLPGLSPCSPECAWSQPLTAATTLMSTSSSTSRQWAQRASCLLRRPVTVRRRRIACCGGPARGHMHPFATGAAARLTASPRRAPRVRCRREE